MNIQLHLILTACIADFVLTFVQPQNQMVHQVVSNEVTNEGEIPENYQNLFNSVAEKDPRKNEIYRNFLINKVAREKQAFDTMKEELQITQVRNTLKKSSSSRRTDDNQNAVAVKRETVEVDDIQNMDDFVRLYGNDVNTSGIWPLAREIAQDDPALKHICAQLHKKLWPHRPELVMYDAIVENKILTFPGTKYVDIKADFLLCEVRPHPAYSMFTKGLGSDCAFLCHKVGNLFPRVFKLANHTCGLEM